MTFKNHPTDFMGNPDGRDYHYRFHANDEEAQKLLKYARWKGRYIETYPKDMKHLRVKIGHKTVKTYDKMGYIKGMKKYAMSPSWQRVPYSRGKMEMKNANGGGTKIQAEERIGEEWGTHTVTFHVSYTPSEIVDALENGVNESAISEEIRTSKMWAVDSKVEELREELYQKQRECDHDRVNREGGIGMVGYCEDCGMDWQHEEEMNAAVEASA